MMNGAGSARLVIAMALALCACGGDGGEPSYDTSAPLDDAEQCAPSHPVDCKTGICRDVVSGQSEDSVSFNDWDSPAIEGTICTRRCSVDGDCGGMSFATANGETVASEQWTCSAGYCAVHVTPPEGGQDACARCLSACAGLSGCCTGSGCLCEAEC